MNGRAARRIRRASWQVIFAEGRTGNISVQRREIEKRLKREYRALPYHRRDLSHLGITSLSHAHQELRWNLRLVDSEPEPEPERSLHDDHSHLRSISEDPDFYDDHSRFKNL